MPALIFDCDGVLADTERDGHRVAFNQMFREFGVPIEWDEETYRSKLTIGGGKERMAAELTPEFVAAQGFPGGAAEHADLVAPWHRRKTEIYKNLVAAGRLPTRPGITRVIADAQDAGWLLGVASTSAEESVRAILEQAAGAERADRFDVFLAGDVVPRKKPAPDIYALAVERLGLPGSEVLVVEDSRNGLLAATYAGLRCVVTVNDYTADEPNDEAVLVVTSLGDPAGEHTTVIANRSAAHPGAYVTLADLAACLDLSSSNTRSRSTSAPETEEPA
jgi:HAD superfamily hydrolase (TIGR01509 family)